MLVSQAEVQAQLERILASRGFSTSTRSAQFLRFCVEQSLNGNRDQIKETTVAVEVFGRAPDYDSKSDPIVRVQAHRLREKLAHYYSQQGANDHILITIPKGSYIPQITRVLPQPKRDFSDWPASTTMLPVARSSFSGSLHPGRIAALILLTIALSGAAITWRARGASIPLHPSVEPLPLNADPGLERDPSWSRDGKFIAFAWDQSPNSSTHQPPHIYVQHIGDPEPRRLSNSGTASANHSEFRPVWSPDGRYIAFLRYLDTSHFEVYRVNHRTGAEERLGVFSYYWPIPDLAPALDWSPDGRNILVAEQISSDAPVHLVQLDLTTGERRLLTQPPNGTTGDLEGKYSPDGRQIAFHRGGYGDLYLIPASGETRSMPAHAVTTSNPGIRGLAWSHDGLHILFGSRGNGNAWGIWQVKADGSDLTPVVSSGFDATAPALSPDGNTLAIEHDDHVTNLTAIPLSGSAEPRSFAPSSRQDYAPVWSPDGRRVAFISTRSGPIELWLADADGSHMEQLTRINGSGFPLSPTWSPDGRRLLFALRLGGNTHLTVTNITTHITRQITFGNGRELSPMYSADGRQIYYVSNAGGQERVWHMDAKGNESAGSNAQPTNWTVPLMLFAATGRNAATDSIVYPDTGHQLHVYRRHLTTGAIENVYQTNRRLTAFNDICFYGDTLYLILSSMEDPLSADLESVDMRTGQARTIRTLHPVPSSLESGCSVSPDGKKLLLTTIEHENNNIYLASLAH